MIELKVITGIKSEKPDYFSLYSTAFINTLNGATKKDFDFKDYDLDTRRKLVWSGVKMMIASRSGSSDWQGVTNKLALFQNISDLASGLTPSEFQTVFPIQKDYDGDKYEMKDYFYTKKYIEEFGEDRIIGEEIDEFLWEYQNWTIHSFVREMIRAVSDLRMINGGKSFLGEFAEELGLTTYTMTEDDKRKQILINNDTGEVQKIRKPRPNYLKIIK